MVTPLFRFPNRTAAVALGLVLSLSGCKSAPAPAATDDASLTTALQGRLQADTGLAGQPLQASVKSGVATLDGTVDSPAARSLAANDAAEIPGIRTVLNNLTVSAPAAAPAVVSPAPVPVAIPPAPAPRPTVAKVAPKPVYQPPVRQPAPIDRRQPAYTQAQNDPQPLPAQEPVRRQPAPPPAPAFRNVSVPVGTGLSVRVTQTLDSETAQPGSAFSGTLASDVIVDGVVAFPAGTRVSGHVDDAKDAGHFSGNSLLAVSLNRISRRGDDVAVSTDTFSKQGNGRGKNTAAKVGGGAAVGAILGGIFGGGKGAAIGAGAGGGLGAGANAVTKGQQVRIESETLIRFRLTQPVDVRVSTADTPTNPGNDLQRRTE